MNRQPRKQRQPVPREADAGLDVDELLWGIHPVLEVMQHHPRRLSEILIQRGKTGTKYQEIIDLARTHQVRLRFVEAGRLGVPGHYSHQGVVARQAAIQLQTLPDLLASAQDATEAKNSLPRLLVLDSIQDPRNLGAILRSALAAGFTSVLLTRERSAPLSGTVARTSAGAINQLQIGQVVNLAEALKEIREQGFWVFGAVLDPEAISVYAADLRVPLCLVIGSEGKGIRPLVRKQCDQLITIPMEGDFDSLNVSVAAAIIMFEAVRQQRSPGTGR
ncbi:MAG TPA: 23S rRNA (guanosine(2251)-2'-O)-methyltransferase RlmB [Desulfobulbaceae bacterium]|nr:23S rRNA (guanosine(2251)-2'-O)-methyltransferase RlmB [Desulfobulbaceae bacterium]